MYLLYKIHFTQFIVILLSENYTDHDNHELVDLDDDVYDGSEPLDERFQRILSRSTEICTPEKPQNVSVRIVK